MRKTTCDQCLESISEDCEDSLSVHSLFSVATLDFCSKKCMRAYARSFCLDCDEGWIADENGMTRCVECDGTGKIDAK